jgi:DNA polymerase I-like protein with 3'-5' exonuclease and polymerase domains
MSLIAIDIETACALGCEKECSHALDPHRNSISVVGCFDGVDGRTFRDLGALSAYLLARPEAGLVAHNGKFDFKVLAAHGLDLTDRWTQDTLLMAATYTEKVSSEYLAWYAAERLRRNKLGAKHREASAHSLKVLAPYFLGVDPFWEADNHDNDEYVLKDVTYTYHLAHFLANALSQRGELAFYRDKLFPWTKMLLEMEQRGVALDMKELERSDADARYEAAKAKARLDTLWQDARIEYECRQISALQASYEEKASRAVERLKDKTKAVGTRLRYQAMFEKAKQKVEPLNLDSPVQLSWLLRDHLKLDITDFHGDEGTGKPILQKLATTRDDIKLFLEYRKQRKLTSAFFPSYREMQHNGTLHCSFNPTGTRTGRLSSSGPNLQQVPGHLHKLVRARPGYKLATYDMSAIEPRLIAYYTQDLRLIDIVNSGADFHGENARIFFGLDCDTSSVKELYPQERKMAKEVGLSLFYGAGSGRLEETSQKYGFHWTRGRCQEVLARFKEHYEGVYEFRDDVIAPVLMSGDAMVNLLGRPFRIDDPTDVHMQGMNTLIQGSASDLVINSAARMTKEFRAQGIDAHVLLLVHDEIVTEIPADKEAECVEIITRSMTDYKLPTALGPIKLLVEGKVADKWEK